MLDKLQSLKIVPVIVIQDADDAVPLARALAEGGLPCAEVTFRTAAAEESIRRIAAEVPEMILGAGTVLTGEQAEKAVSAGAKFIVTPGFNPPVVDWCLDRDVPIYPGVCTPTEVDMAMQKGLEVLKFFPAEAAGGVAFLKAISAPYTTIRFIPTGGVNTKNLPEYLALKSVVACGGSWMAPSEWISNKQFDRIRQETASAVQAVRNATEGGAR